MGLEYADPEREPVRRALGSFAAGVTVITTEDDAAAAVGMTATAFTAVSFSPPSVLVCMAIAGRTQSLIRSTGRYGVNLLGADAQNVSDFCAVPGSDKSLPSDWVEQEARWESPCLNTSMAFFDCHVADAVETGTHVIIVGDVKSVGLSHARMSTSPLIHFRGAYRRLNPIKGGSIPAPLPIVFEDSLLMEMH
jgi:flavin-dependent trigonelline monooxygenase, reductase component